MRWTAVLWAIGVGAAAAAAATSSNISQVTLDWENVNVELLAKTKGNRMRLSVKKLLDQACGKAEPGKVLAILGPSGSGKTTLLNMLSAQLPASPSIGVSGRLFVNGLKQRGIGRLHSQAYVRQQDLFYSQLTVRETLMMAARLRLPQDMSLRDKEKVVDGILTRLGLAKVAHTIVGDEKVRGISGGEKKRLSLACELVGSPSLIFADEPTSGLDAFAAETVVKSLRDLARAGHTVVMSIHQPRSSVYAMIDDILLLADGHVVYSGPADALTDYFSALGYQCPKRHNPAEFALDLISVDYSSKTTETESRARVDSLIEAHRSRAPKILDQIRKERALVRKAHKGQRHSLTGMLRRGPRLLEQFKLLFKRSWRQVTRDKGTTIARAMSNIFSAVVFGFLFLRLGRSQTSIQDRMGLLQVAAINCAMSSLIKTITVFIKERLIVDRERSGGKESSYGAGPYFLSKLAAELPFTALFPCLFGTIVYPLTGLKADPMAFARFLGALILESYAAAGFGMVCGCLVPSVDAGLAVAPAAMVLFIIMGGYYVNQKSVPAALRWIQEISMIRWAFQALCVNEFTGLTFDTEGIKGPPKQAMTSTGEQVLDRLNFDTSLKRPFAAQAAIASSTYLITYLLLALRKPKYQKVEDVDDGGAREGEEGVEEEGELAMSQTGGRLVRKKGGVSSSGVKNMATKKHQRVTPVPSTTFQRPVRSGGTWSL